MKKAQESKIIMIEIKENIKNIESLKPVISKHGFTKVIDLINENYSVEHIENYYMSYIKYNFTDKRVKVTNNKFYNSIYGIPSSFCKWLERHREHEHITYIAVDTSYEIQKKEFIDGNRKEMSLDKDKWTLYFLKGPALNKRTFDFGKIDSHTMRKEVKIYFKNKLWHETNFRNDKGIALITRGINLITNEFKDVEYFKDISNIHRDYLFKILQTNNIKSQFGKKLSVSSIRKTIQNLGLVTDYLMSLNNYYNRPKYNYFKEVSFKNTSGMEENTKIIPEEVIEQLNKYYIEMNNEYRLIYEILYHTGLRIKEITHLKYDCLSKSDVDMSYYLLTYTPFKILNNLKMAGLEEIQQVAIQKELALKIIKRIKETQELRGISNSPYIFISRYNDKGNRISLAQEYSFVNAVNRLIKKHKIVDLNGNLWRFSSRQVRKTLAVKLAEDGATSQEIANQFGHMNIRTTEKYYAEVRNKKLAELNSEFFKKKFTIYVGEENLKKFTEEERRQLYVDFAMNVREVEFGQCSKHISEGPCGMRTGKISCANCPKLCTGIEYLEKWIELRDCQKEIVDGLIKIYTKECITDYEDFIEYKKEVKFLNMYQSVINKILQ